MKSIVLSPQEWGHIQKLLAQEYPPSYTLMRSVMRRELGFTPRFHVNWVASATDYDEAFTYPRDEVHLDFYNESAKTFFILKYLNR